MTAAKARPRKRAVRPTMTAAEIDSLGVSTDLPTANRALGLSRDAGYDLAARDAYPIPIIRAGARYVVPTAGLRRALGLSETA